jgi:hypothetical protein
MGSKCRREDLIAWRGIVYKAFYVPKEKAAKVSFALSLSR